MPPQIFTTLLIAAIHVWVVYQVGAQQGSNDDLTVKTAQGPVVGTRPYGNVRQWLGIPFARAARWQPPSPPPPRRAPFKATSFGDTCPQLISPTISKYLQFAHQNETLKESEDCLTVNIWAPSKNRRSNHPVFVWIYGGGLQFGASALKVYNGKEWVKDNDIVVVSFNYRINILGQPNAPQLVNTTRSQNFGLLDQRAAIEWIHANIAHFGGDPSRITISGHSAGGTSAGFYTLAYPDDTVVKGIVEVSGGVSARELTTPTLDSDTWNRVADAVGCGSDPTPAQFSCMTRTPAHSLINAANALRIIFFRLLADGLTVFSDVPERMKAGRFLQVPTVLGNVANEGDAATVASHITTRGAAIPVLTSVISDLNTQVAGGHCASAEEALDRVNAGSPVWRYRYQATFPGISFLQDLRSFHGSDIPIIFGTYKSIPGNHDPIEVALSAYFQKALTAFVKNPTSGLTSFGWPRYNPTQETLLLLGDRANRAGLTLFSPALADTICAHIPQVREWIAEFTALLPPPIV